MCADLIAKKILNVLISNYSDPITMIQLELDTEISRFKILRSFRKVHQITPLEWLWKYRLSLALEQLTSASKLSCEDIALSCGFQSVAHFSRMFKKSYGIPPSHFRNLYQDLSKKVEPIPSQKDLKFSDNFLTITSCKIADSFNRPSPALPRQSHVS